jgi:hypothetical protein
MPNVGKIVTKVAKKVVKNVKVSPNVTVKAPKGKTISAAEQARLKNINKTTKTTAKDTKKSAKALKASGKVKPKTDTMYERFLPNSFETEKITARALAREKAAKRAAKK